MRAVIRFGLRLFPPRLRLLNRERLERPGPAILLVTHPRSLPAALLLVSALDRRIHCLLPSRELRGVFRKLAAWALGMQAVDLNSEEQNHWLNPCLNVLANQEAIALFAEHAPESGDPRAPVADFAARLSMEAILRDPEDTHPTIYPIHCFLHTGRRYDAPLMSVDSPIASQDFLPKVAEDLAAASQQLADAVQNSIGANTFGLPAAELERFHQELEDLSREHLRKQWSRHPNWKQRPEDLDLSTFARKWIARQNRMDPAQLVELRESVTAYRGARRRWSMGKLMVETSGPWQASGPRVAAAWLETTLGLPVAVYGLINHLPALIVLRASGLLQPLLPKGPQSRMVVAYLYCSEFLHGPDLPGSLLVGQGGCGLLHFDPARFRRLSMALSLAGPAPDPRAGLEGFAPTPLGACHTREREYPRKVQPRTRAVSAICRRAGRGPGRPCPMRATRNGRSLTSHRRTTPHTRGRRYFPPGRADLH